MPEYPEHNPNALFFPVDFTIITSDKLSEDEAEGIKNLLVDNGATYIPLLENGHIDDITQHSHIISTHVDFPEYTGALDKNCHVVRPDWVYQSITSGKAKQTRQFSPDPVLIFSEVVVTCADLPSGDKDAITAGVMALGGMYSSPLSRLVTHIVSLTEDHDKIRVARDKGLACRVVLPHWFDDCLKLGRKISEAPYLLPDPEILKGHGALRGPIRSQAVPDLDGAVSAVAGNPPRLTPPPSSPVEPATPRKTLNAFSGKQILFSKDLNINNRLARTLEELVQHGGGSLTQDVLECDIYIGHYREGQEYIAASRAGKEVANLAWFYSVITRNRWTNPLNKLLHYPVPRHGIPGFKDMKISLSNYTGESRLYLENIVREAGAEFTRTMKQDNTHLITAHRVSEKCEAAEEWNINIVNHLWLEESYAKCAVQSLTNSRYTHFPQRTNLSEIVGQMQIDLKKLESMYFAKDEKTIRDVEQEEGRRPSSTKAPHPSRGAVMPRPSPRKTVPASAVKAEAVGALPDASTFSGDDAAAAFPEDDGQDGVAPLAEDAEDGAEDGAVAPEDDTDMPPPPDDEQESTPVPRTQRKRKSKGQETYTPSVAMTHWSSGKENESPLLTSGRSSKQKAMNKLHEYAPDIALFQKEMKQKGGVTHGRKRSSVEAEAEEDAAPGSEPEEELQRATQRLAKRPKTAPAEPPVLYRMMVSGDERWKANTKKEAEDKKTLRNLGIVLTLDPANCTLLCAPRILRTRKFIAALALAPTVVSIGYLDYALKYNSLHSVIDFPIYDKDAEERLGFRLADSIARARDNDRKLLRGWTIYVTDSVAGGFETFDEIISINGGTAIPYRGRTGVQIPKRRLRLEDDPDAGLESQNQGGDEETDYVYLVSGTEDRDLKVWSTFRKLAEKQDLQARIVSPDWIINAAMGQKIEWDEKWELKEELVPGWEGKRR